MDTNFLTTDEVAARLKVTPWTVRQWLKAGTIRGVKINRSWRVPEQNLDALVSKTEIPANSSPPFQDLVATIRAARGSMAHLPFSMTDYLSERQREAEAEEEGAYR